MILYDGFSLHSAWFGVGVLYLEDHPMTWIRGFPKHGDRFRPPRRGASFGPLPNGHRGIASAAVPAQASAGVPAQAMAMVAWWCWLDFFHHFGWYLPGKMMIFMG